MAVRYIWERTHAAPCVVAGLVALETVRAAERKARVYPNAAGHTLLLSLLLPVLYKDGEVATPPCKDPMSSLCVQPGNYECLLPLLLLIN